MSEHTPGPWKADDDGRIVVAPDWIGDERNFHVVICETIDTEEGLEGDCPEARANAALIAAAPDYFAGVEKMLANEECGGDGWWDGWAMIKAAHARTKSQ